MLPDRDIAALREYCLLALEARRAKQEYDACSADLDEMEPRVRGILKRLNIPFTDLSTGVTLSTAVERTFKPEHPEQAIKDLRACGLDYHTRTVIVDRKMLNRRIKAEGLWQNLKQSFGVYKRPVVRIQFDDRP